jgi:outer membrane protein assembly factor BamB
MLRGTSGNTGASASGGPGPDASLTREIEFRDGFNVGVRRPPIVGDDGVYAVAWEKFPLDHEPPKHALYAYRHDLGDGSEVWRRTIWTAEEVPRPYNRGQRACLGPDALYVFRRGPGADGETVRQIVALARADGSVLWERIIDGYDSMFPPVLRGGTLYVQRGRDVLALDAGDGGTRWESGEIASLQGVTCVGERGIAVYNERAGTGTAPDRQLSILEPDTGAVRWSRPIPDVVRPNPTIAGETVYLAVANPGEGEKASGRTVDHARRKVHARSVGDGSERWTHTYETDAIQQSVARGGARSVTVTADRVFYALGFESAFEIAGRDQERRERLEEELYRGPNVVALDRTDGSVVWETTVGPQARVFLPLVAGPDHLYAHYRAVPSADEGTAEPRSRVVVIDRADGTVRGSFGSVHWKDRLAVAGGRVFTQTGGGAKIWA